MLVTEDYVSFETAKLLKEKGFLKGVDLRMTQNLSFYDNIGLTHNLNNFIDSLIQDKIEFVVAPTLQMAMKWLREVHNIYIEITPCSKTNEFIVDSYRIDIVTKTFDTIYVSSGYDSYEEACEAAIKYCPEHLIL